MPSRVSSPSPSPTSPAYKMGDDIIMVYAPPPRVTRTSAQVPVTSEHQEEDEENVVEIPAMERDWINDLPDHLLVSIISLLPVRYAVRTGTVSRRWRSLWARATRLDFDRRSLRSSSMTQAVIIGNVLARHSVAAAVQSCRIAHSEQRSVKEAITGWVQELGRRHVKRLRLDGPARFVYPSHAFSVHSLQELELGPCRLMDASPLSGCTGLRCLRLRRTQMTDATPLAITTGCPQLERLMLQCCKGLRHPQIGSQALKHLEMVDMRLSTVELDVPALASLTMDAINCENGVMLRAPRLRTLSTYATKSESEFADVCKKGKEGKRPSLHSIELLELWSGIYENNELSKLRIDASLFMKLCTLSININLNDFRQVVVLSWVLRECRYLRELNIKNEKVFINSQYPPSLPYSESDYWQKQEFFECLEDQLEHVSVKDFTGEILEVEFVRFLIQKALVLKRLVVWHKNLEDINLEPVMFLLSSSLPRGSPDVRVLLKPEVKDWKDRNLHSNPLKRRWCSIVQD